MMKPVMNNRQRTWLRRVLASRMKSTFVIPAMGAGLMLGAMALPGRADTFVVDGVGTEPGTYASLGTAITALNADTSSTTNTISFTGGALVNGVYTETGDLPPITNSVDINSGGSTITINANGNSAFMVGTGDSTSPKINVSFNNLTITGAVAQGGNGGGGGGGGGAGLGGAVFVNSNANVTLNSVSFTDNKAQGGTGGTGNVGGNGGGGGGGLSGGNGGGGTIPGGGTGGGTNGGAGGYTGNAASGGSGGGGGGGGGEADVFSSVGGDGGFGGGGGGGGGTGGTGGSGGFGGGGGGGGGGAGLGGFGGGNGGSAGLGTGGGGAGFGGAVFVRNGGNLTIEGNTDINGNTVQSGNGGTNGAAAGGGIFLNGQDLTIGSNTDTSNSLTTINDDITDGYTDGGGTYHVSTDGGAGSITKDGAGTLVLGGDNSYTGATSVYGGILQNNGTIASSNVTAYSGGTFNNYGTVSDPTADGGVVNNGDPSGTPSGTVAEGYAINGGTFNNNLNSIITGAAAVGSADGGTTVDSSPSSSVFNNDGIIEGNATAYAGTFNNDNFGEVKGNAYVNGGTFNNIGHVDNNATVSSGIFNNNNGYVGGTANVTGGTFNNNYNGEVISGVSVSSGTFNNYDGGIVEGNVTVTGGTFNNIGNYYGNGAEVFGSANVSGGYLNADNGAFFGSINLTNDGAGGAGSEPISGSGNTINVGSYVAYPYPSVSSITGVYNDGSGTFTVGASIGSADAAANDNTVTTELNYGGSGNAVENSGSGDFALGNGDIYGDGNIVNTSLLTGGNGNPPGNIVQNGTGSTIVGGGNIVGNTNSVTNTVGDIAASNGTVNADFSNITGGGNTSITNLGNQNISGTAVGHYGDGGVSLSPGSNSNSNTLNINGIEVDNNDAGGASANIGGGTNYISGSGNNYQVNVNADTSVNPNNTTAINLTNGATATLSGGTNFIQGSNNNFSNKVNGDVSVDQSTFNLNAGIISADPVASTNNTTGNDITGNVTLTNGSTLNITGQTTDGTNSGTNVSSNTIGGANGLTADSSSINVIGHNNTVTNGVTLQNFGLLSIYGQDVTRLSNQNLENSLTGSVAMNGGILLVGANINNSNTPQNVTGNGNIITNTIHGTISPTGGNTIAEVSGANITGSNNHINNVLTQAFDLTNGMTLEQGGGQLQVNGGGTGNQINNSITGDVTVDGGTLQQQGGVVANADRTSNGGSSSGYSASDINGNQITNIIEGSVAVNNGNFLIDGERNIVTGGVTTTSVTGTHIGGISEGQVSDPYIHNESTSNQTVSGGGHLHIGTNPGPTTQTITGNTNIILNRVIGDNTLDPPIEGSITVTGAGSVLGLGDGLSDSGDLEIDGSGNVITNEVSKTYTADGEAQLQTVTGGGEVLLGGRNITSSSTGNVVNNIIDQDVTLGADSSDSGYLVLAGTGAGSNTDANAATVNNTVIDRVTAYGSSNVLLEGSDGVTAFNSIGGSLILNNSSTLQAQDGGLDSNAQLGNIVQGGILLNNTASGNVGGTITSGTTHNEVLSTGTGGLKNTGTGTFSVGNRTITGSNDTVTTVLDNSDYNRTGAAVQNTGGGTFLVGAIPLNEISGNLLIVNNTSIGNISQSNDSITVLNGAINGGSYFSQFNNLISGNVDSDTGSVTLEGNILHNAVGDGYGNAVTNTISGEVTMTDGYVDLNGGTISADNPGSSATANSITNTIDGPVTLYGNSQLNFVGDSNVNDNNVISNAIDSKVLLQSGTGISDSQESPVAIVTGGNNSITPTSGYGLELKTTTNTAVQSGDNELNSVTKLIIGGPSTATSSDVLNELSVGGSGVVVDANPYSDTNSNEQRADDHGYNIDSGHIYVGAFGGSNTANGYSITNKLDSNVTMLGDYGGQGSLLNSGGMIVVGGAGDALGNGGTVTNEITGDVTLNGGSRLHMGGDSITGTGGSVTNKIDGAVTANGNSYVAMWGENDPRMSNTIGANVTGAGNYGLTLNDSALFHAEGQDDVVGGQGTELNGNSVATFAGGAHANRAINNMYGGYTLNNSSTLQIGDDSVFAYGPVNGSYQTNTIWSNGTNGDVVLNDASTLKVLSGGAGGIHSALGLNDIKNNLDLNNNEGSNTKFLVNVGNQGEDTNNPVSTGVQVDNQANLNNAQVLVNDTDAINPNTGHADYLFGRQYTLVTGNGYGVASGFASNAQLVDSNGNPIDLPALDLTTGWNNSSAWLNWETDFHSVAQTTNQKNFGQYLDNLVANSSPNGITNPTLSSLLNQLVGQSNPNTYNNYLGDSYSAFDMVGYQNASNFAHAVATHAKENPLYTDSGNSGDNPMYEGENFAENGQQGISGVGAQLSLVQQMLQPRPVMELAANGDDSNSESSSLWGSVGGNWLRNDGDSSLGSPDWSQDSKNVTLGYEGGSDSFSWGLTGGYHNGDIDFNNRAANGKNDGWNAGLNALWQNKSHTYVNGVLSYGHESDSLTRNDGLGTNSSNFDAKSYSALLEIGKRIDKKTYSFTPYVSLLGVKYDRDGATEQGTGAGLSVNSESHSYLTSNLGIRIGRTYLDNNGEKRGGVMLGASWQHQFSSTDFPVTASLNSAIGMTPTSYTTYGTPLASDSLGVQLGGYAKLSKSLYGFLNYSGNFGGNQKINSITAGLQYGF